MGEEASWHIVRIRGADAAIAAIGVEKAGLEVYMPVSMVRVGTRGNRLQPGGVRWQPVFPGSLFVRFDLGRDLRRVCEIYGIDDAVRQNGKLASISDDAVKALRSAKRRGAFDAALGCRAPDDDAPPPNVQFANLMRRIKRERGSKKRTALLMELLLGNHSL
jgi:hypothetical protein